MLTRTNRNVAVARTATVAAIGVACCFALSTAGAHAVHADVVPSSSEARSVAMAYFSKLMSKCGTDYLVQQPGVSQTQMRSVTFRIEPNEIGEVDRMNGVQARFIVSAIPRAWRLRLASWSGTGSWGTWDDWRAECYGQHGTGSACDVALTATIEKRHGAWVYSTSGLPAFDRDDIHPIETLTSNRPACDKQD